MSDERRMTSDESPETTEDIVAEMREKTTDQCVWSIFDRAIRRWADRIEKAAARAETNREYLVNANEMLQAECRGLAAEADRMAEFVRKLCDMVADHPIWRPSEAEQWLIAEARKAIGEEDDDR